MLEGVPNFRDLTGIACDNGRVVRAGRLLRSGQLSNPTAGDLRRLASYKVRLVCDLRSADERAQAANLWPAPQSVQTLLVDAVGGEGADAVRPSSWRELLRDPAFDGAAAREHMMTGYRRMPRAFAGVLARLFAFLDREDDGAVLIHCVAGKDRTGFACAMLLWALGASKASIRTDFLSSRALAARDSGLEVNRATSVGSSYPAHAAQAVAVMAGVDVAYLDAAFAEIERRYRSLDAYLADAAGADAALRQRLRERLLVEP